ncbi:hypothetical protein GQ457_07G009690 [Hibiscus cannabinus]
MVEGPEQSNATSTLNEAEKIDASTKFEDSDAKNTTTTLMLKWRYFANGVFLEEPKLLDLKPSKAGYNCLGEDAQSWLHPTMMEFGENEKDTSTMVTQERVAEIPLTQLFLGRIFTRWRVRMDYKNRIMVEGATIVKKKANVTRIVLESAHVATIPQLPTNLVSSLITVTSANFRDDEKPLKNDPPNFEGRNPVATASRNCRSRYISELRSSANSLSHPNVCIGARWLLPSDPEVKINIDANSAGFVLGAAHRTNASVRTAFEAEAIAVCQGLQFGEEIGCRDVLVEGDSRSVMQKLNSSVADVSILCPIITTTKALACRFRSCRFLFTGRNSNKVAHAMARVGRLEPVDGYWIENAPPDVLSAMAIDRRWIDPP